MAYAIATIASDSANRVFTRQERADALVGAFAKTDQVFDRIQSVLLSLLIEMETWGKKELIEDPALNRVFTCETQGPVRARLAKWMEAHTPLALKLERNKETGKPTGRVLGLRIPKKANPWALEAGSRVRFMEFSDATAVKALSDPALERAFEAVAREAARLLDVDANTTINTVKAQIMDGLLDKLAERVMKIKESEKHEKWVSRFQAEREEARRVG